MLVTLDTFHSESCLTHSRTLLHTYPRGLCTLALPYAYAPLNCDVSCATLPPQTERNAIQLCGAILGLEQQCLVLQNSGSRATLHSCNHLTIDTKMYPTCVHCISSDFSYVTCGCRWVCSSPAPPPPPLHSPTPAPHSPHVLIQSHRRAWVR